MAGEIPECRNSHWKEKPWACSPADSRIQLGALLPATKGIAMDIPGIAGCTWSHGWEGSPSTGIPGGGVLLSMVTGADIILGWILLGI